jgi:hypothetical protein
MFNQSSNNLSVHHVVADQVEAEAVVTEVIAVAAEAVVVANSALGIRA